MDISLALLLAFSAAAQKYDLPKGLLNAVCYVESTHRVHAVRVNDGGSNSVGVCMVKLATARGLGFKGDEKELAKFSTNIEYAARYMRHQIRRYNGDVVKGVAAYNAGTCKINASGSIRNNRYVKKVFTAWAEGR